MNPHLDIKKFLFDLLFQIKVKMKDVIEAAESPLRLTPTQIIILRFLVENKALAQADLVRMMKRDKSQITRLVSDLEEKGLVKKTQDPNDGRRFILEASLEVRTKMGIFYEKEEAMVAELLKGISKKDVATLGRLLVQMKENLEDA